MTTGSHWCASEAANAPDRVLVHSAELHKMPQPYGCHCWANSAVLTKLTQNHANNAKLYAVASHCFSGPDTKAGSPAGSSGSQPTTMSNAWDPVWPPSFALTHSSRCRAMQCMKSSSKGLDQDTQPAWPGVICQFCTALTQAARSKHTLGHSCGFHGSVHPQIYSLHAYHVMQQKHSWILS